MEIEEEVQAKCRKLRTENFTNLQRFPYRFKRPLELQKCKIRIEHLHIIFLLKH
jgi:hypothetical protein